MMIEALENKLPTDPEYHIPVMKGIRVFFDVLEAALFMYATSNFTDAEYLKLTAAAMGAIHCEFFTQPFLWELSKYIGE